MKILRKFCNFLSNICCGISAASCVAMMIVVTLDTSGRTLFSRPITGTFEICQYLLCLILFGGYAYCQSKHGFLHVTMFIRKMHWRACCITWAFSSLFSVVVGALLSYQCLQQSLYIKSVNATSTLLSIPQFPFELFASIAMMILVLNLIADTIHAIMAIFNKGYADEIIAEWI